MPEGAAAIHEYINVVDELSRVRLRALRHGGMSWGCCISGSRGRLDGSSVSCSFGECRQTNGNLFFVFFFFPFYLWNDSKCIYIEAGMLKECTY